MFAVGKTLTLPVALSTHLPAYKADELRDILPNPLVDKFPFAFTISWTIAGN